MLGLLRYAEQPLYVGFKHGAVQNACNYRRVKSVSIKSINHFSREYQTRQPITDAYILELAHSGQQRVTRSSAGIVPNLNDAYSKKLRNDACQYTAKTRQQACSFTMIVTAAAAGKDIALAFEIHVRWHSFLFFTLVCRVLSIIIIQIFFLIFSI